MSTERTLAEQLAQTRQRGEVFASKKVLFPKPALPTWAALRLVPYVAVLGVCFLLYLLSLVFLWDRFNDGHAFAGLETKYVVLSIALNYLLLIWSACMIQLRLQQAGLQKSGWGLTLFGFVVFNPLILGWAVPLFVLGRVALTYRLLQANAPTVTAGPAASR